MRGQRRVVVRRSVAATAALLMGCTLASCSDDDVSAQQPGRNIEPAPAAPTDDALTQVASSSGLRVPGWMPASLPVPEGASVTAVGVEACTVSFLLPAADAQVVGGDVGTSARGNGLAVELVSSVSQSEPAPEPEVEAGLFDEQEAPVVRVLTHVEVLRLRGAAASRGAAPLDAELTLTSRGDGFVSGEYVLAEAACAS